MAHWGNEIFFKVWCVFWPDHKEHALAKVSFLPNGRYGMRRVEIKCNCSFTGTLDENNVFAVLEDTTQDPTSSLSTTVAPSVPDPMLKEAALFFGGMNLQDQPIQIQRNVVSMIRRLMAASKAK